MNFNVKLQWNPPLKTYLYNFNDELQRNLLIRLTGNWNLQKISIECRYPSGLIMISNPESKTDRIFI